MTEKSLFFFIIANKIKLNIRKLYIKMDKTVEIIFLPEAEFNHLV